MQEIVILNQMDMKFTRYYFARDLKPDRLQSGYFYSIVSKLLKRVFVMI